MPSLFSKANSLLLLTLLPSITTSAPAPNQGPGCSNGANGNKPATTGKAIYFLSNDADNAVVALPIDKDGKLSAGTSTKTGGKGSNSLNAMMKPAKPDALLSQSALTVVGNNIFAVNAGSNTLSMLSISKSDPTSLQLVGQPAPLPGDFPNTVAASMKNKLVCAGTTGAKAGISCASFSSRNGIGKMDALRPFALGQTTPPVGPLNTVSHAFFNADESLLLTTVKGDPPNNKTGFLSVFPVEGNGCLASQGVQTSPNGTAVLFGSALVPGSKSHIFTTDASFGAAVLALDAQGQASVVGKQAIEGQMATCWAAVSDVSGTAFVSDVARNTLVEMSLKDASIVSSMQVKAGANTGFIDMRAAGNFVYALSPGNASEAVVSVMDVSAGAGKAKQVQDFGVGKLAGGNAQGMAVLV